MKNTSYSQSQVNLLGNFIGLILSTTNRLYIGCFGILMFPLLTLATIAYITAFIMAPAVDIDGIREPVAGSLLAESAGDISLNLGYKFGQEDETYSIGLILSTTNRLYIGCFGILMFPLLTLATIAYITAFIMAPAVDIDGIREPVAGSLLAESAGDISLNLGYKFGQEDETYSISAAHGYFGRLIFQYASFNNSRSLHFFLAAWPVIGIWFTALGVSTMAFNLNGLNFNQSILDSSGHLILSWADILNAHTLVFTERSEQLRVSALCGPSFVLKNWSIGLVSLPITLVR